MIELFCELDQMIDEDITVQPSLGMPKQVTADGAPAVPEPTSRDKTTVDSAADALKSAGAITVGLGGAIAGIKTASDPKISGIADKAQPAAEASHFDIDFHLDDADKPAPFKAKQAPTLSTALVDGNGNGNTPTPSQLSRPAAALELDKLDLSFGPERTTFEDPTPSVLDGQWHDAATKLDLAKAYQEMGDVEGAREILQEVLHEGDDEQKAEAQALITKLA